MLCSMPWSSSLRTRLRMVALMRALPALCGAYLSLSTRWRGPSGSPDAVGSVSLRVYGEQRLRTVELRVAVSCLCAVVGGGPAVGHTQLRRRGVQQLHENEDEDAEGGSRQVAHALGQRHGVRWELGAIGGRSTPSEN